MNELEARLTRLERCVVTLAEQLGQHIELVLTNTEKELEGLKQDRDLSRRTFELLDDMLMRIEVIEEQVPPPPQHIEPEKPVEASV